MIFVKNMPEFVIIKAIKRNRYSITIPKDRRVLISHVLFSFTKGVSGKMSTESAGEDDNFGTESSQQVWKYSQICLKLPLKKKTKRRS